MRAHLFRCGKWCNLLFAMRHNVKVQLRNYDYCQGSSTAMTSIGRSGHKPHTVASRSSEPFNLWTTNTRADACSQKAAACGMRLLQLLPAAATAWPECSLSMQPASVPHVLMYSNILCRISCTLKINECRSCMNMHTFA